MKYIISYSGGMGSFGAALLAVKKYGKENCRLVFTDTKTEDEDLYRFLQETAKYLDIEFTTLADGRNIWEVFEAVRFHGNNRIDPCSRVLKRELFRRWVDAEYGPEKAIIVFGIGPSESHRMKSIRERWAPYKTIAPLIESHDSGNGWGSRDDIEEVLDLAGIKIPRLYELGFEHNNCGGFCVKTGQKQMERLWKTLPDRYFWHEEQQEKLFEVIGKRHGFIRKVEDGELKYLSLRQFRETLQKGEQIEMFPDSGCGCFV